MYFKLKSPRKIFQLAIDKSGSHRKLAKELNIPRNSILNYRDGAAIPEERFKQIINFLEIDNEGLIKEKLDSNFRQRIGGHKCVIAKKKKGTFERDMKMIQQKQSEKLKKWHRFMKKNKPEEYYQIRYSRFKKIGRYKNKTKRGEKVRNLFEKQIADILHNLGIDYKYEFLVKSGGRYFFPDFLINNEIIVNEIIVECTEWRGEAKAYRLYEKIKYLKKNYKVFVVIPKHLYRCYKILDYYLILGLDNFVSVAQTFPKGKT